MTKRSLFLALAAGLLASVAFATPSHAASQTITVGAAFNLQPTDVTASEIDITLTGAVPASGYSLISAGGLSDVMVTGSGNMLKITFDAIDATSPTTLPALSFSFTNSVGLGITGYSLTGGTTAGGYSSSGLQVSILNRGASTPEPTSVALLGIGMTGFLAFRRLFKRPSVA